MAESRGKTSFYISVYYLLHIVQYFLLSAIFIQLASSIGLRVPYVYEVKEVAQFWWSVVKPASTHLSYMLAINTICASTISYKQAVSMEIVADVLLKMDEDRS